MPAVEIKPGVYWVGVTDWNIRSFHGPTYSTHRGTTYNAYLIVDEQITLVDTVYAPFTDQLIANISQIIDPSSIDNVVVNHLEMDHSGAFPAIMKLNPQAKVYASPNGKTGLPKHFAGDWKITAVKTGDSIKLGRRSLSFIEAPMLHWPDSMFSYLPEEKLLLPNDAFGQHFASNMIFDDQADLNVVMAEAAKYYANILYPFSKLVLKKLEEINQLNLEIDMIAPSHGVIWRSHVPEILAKYQAWAGGQVEPKAVIAYDTMWESTAKLAHALLEGLTEGGVSARLYQISKSDVNDIITEVMEARAVLVGSSTINNDIIPSVAPFLDEMVGLKLGGRLGLAFGSQGWAGGATKTIEERLKKAGLEMAAEPYTVKWVPNEEELNQARDLGRSLARQIRPSE